MMQPPAKYTVGYFDSYINDRPCKHFCPLYMRREIISRLPSKDRFHYYKTSCAISFKIQPFSRFTLSLIKQHLFYTTRFVSKPNTMRPLALLLSFAAASSAIDVYLYTSNDCIDEYTAALDADPDVCIGPKTSDHWTSIEYRDIPINSSLNVRAYHGGACDNRNPIYETVSNTESYCHQFDSLKWSGAAYSIESAKRDIDVFDDTCSASVDGECTPTKMNRIGTKDGTVYNLDEMDDETYNAMVRIP